LVGVGAVIPVVRLLRELIAIPSVNPALLPSGDPRAGERRIGEFVAATAARAGLVVEMRGVGDDRFNVLARWLPSGPIRHRILLAPHLDTVGEPELARQLQPQIRRGRVYGRGACDTKGCVAAMLQSLMNVAASGWRAEHTEIVFVGLVDEEHAQRGARLHARRGPTADLAIVGEPTRLEVVTAHKGNVWMRIETRGRAAHGSTPRLGVNAIHSMARLVDAIETRLAERLEERTHPLLGSATINVGVIHGGTQANIVADVCRVDVDRRTLPGENEASVRRELQQVMREVGVKATFVPLKSVDCNPLETDPDLPFVRSLMRAAGRRRTVGVNYFCDASPLAAGGIPSVVFGPGDIARAHTTEEWIEIEQLERGVEVLERFMRSLP
jgi:succinyl-diaminopimelate desuccinylase